MEIYHQIGAGKKMDNLNSQQTQHVYVNQAAQSGPPFIQSMIQSCRFFVGHESCLATLPLRVTPSSDQVA